MRKIVSTHFWLSTRSSAWRKKGERVIVLRTFEDSEVSLLEKWLYVPHVAKWYKHPDHWLEEIHGRHSDFSFITHFIVVANGTPIGFCQYYDTHFAQEHEVWNDEPHISQKKGEISRID